ncbi:MAG: Fic family protein [Candidatus Omnitrophota bacterium]
MEISYSPKFERSARLIQHLTQASSLCAWIQEQAIDVSWIAPTQRDALVRLAHYSTRIEGNPLTLPEVEALAMGKDLAVEEHAKREVLNYFAALRWIWTKSPTYTIEEKELLNLHRLLTQGLLPLSESGTYKTKPNAVFKDSRIIYKPPPPEASPILTCSLLKWLNSNEARDEHTVIVAAIAHHRLVSIHPFLDGNGRVARALESWLLYHRGFDTYHIFALDEFFEIDRERYYNEIQKVRRQEENLTSWLEYLGEGIVETLRKTQRRIQSIRTKMPITKFTLNHQQERIMRILGEVPKISGGELARSLGISRSHLSKVLSPLVKTGLVIKEGSTKAAIYRLT